MRHIFICGLSDSTTLFSLLIELFNDNTTAHSMVINNEQFVGFVRIKYSVHSVYMYVCTYVYYVCSCECDRLKLQNSGLISTQLCVK